MDRRGRRSRSRSRDRGHDDRSVRPRGSRADGLTSLVRLPLEEDAWEARGELRAALDARFHRKQDPYPRGCEAHRELWCGRPETLT
jgi:hypothetical protein